MRLALAGVSHHRAPLELRERVAVDLETAGVLARELSPKDDAASCTARDAFDDGWEAYRLGLRFVVDQPPDGTTAWKWRCSWPTPFAPVVAALEAREGLPRGLMHAILRQESAFRIDVVSPAGAVGIAQLMPATAAQTAAAIGMTIDQSDIAALQAPWVGGVLDRRGAGDLAARPAPRSRSATGHTDVGLAKIKTRLILICISKTLRPASMHPVREIPPTRK